MSERKPYPSDLSDERWALIEPVITAWKAAHPSVSGHQGSYAMREIVNAIFYQGRTGCQRDYLPHDLPPRSAVSCYFARWRDDGTDQAIHDLLRWQAREQRGRLADPSLVVPATQSVHAAAGVPASTTGNDAGKRVHGRKRGLAVDALGLVVAVAVLDMIDARGQALAREAGQARAQIEDLAARLRELDEAIDHLQITRKTLLSLAAEPAAEPAQPPPVLPGHPLYQQILAIFGDAAGPMRARDLCQALDLPIAPKHTENIRSKLKRLASRGILVETEPGLFTQPRP
jgi:transposase